MKSLAISINFSELVDIFVKSGVIKFELYNASSINTRSVISSGMNLTASIVVDTS
jgi:hypothetical protein